MSEGLMIRRPSCILQFLRPLTLTATPPSSLRAFFCNINTTSTRNTRSNAFRASSKMNNLLTKQQEQILTSISNGKSVFITGSAGTGKTFLLQQAINTLKQIHNPNEVFITASTGVAACALNGQTLHSFSGIGLGQGGKDLLLQRVYKNKQSSKRWRIAKALVIDEISMVSGELFDNLEFIARKNRPPHKNETYWGGIQLIVCGDFFQLPPIIKNSPASSFEPDNNKEFAFEADCWNSSFDLQVELTQVFRQSESQFVELLQGIRRGFKDAHHLKLLGQCCLDESRLADEIGSDSSSTVPRLYPRNEDVKRVNEEKLRNLGGEIVSYRAVDSGSEPWKRQLKQGIAPEELDICLGARVMLIKNKNVETGLVNGATGTITRFIEQKEGVIRRICPRGGLLPLVRFDCGLEMLIEPDSWDVMEGEKVLATRKQVPLILAWAISIHKCQGMSLDSIYTDLSRAFGCGMVYVVLSRVRSLGGLHLSGFDASKIKAHPKVLQFYEGHLASS